MLIYVLIILLLLILYWAYASMGKDIASPAFLFVAPFTLACMCAAVYSDKWLLNMHANTFMVLFGGCFELALLCWLIHNSLGNKLKNRIEMQEKIRLSEINVNVIKILPVIVFQLISLYVVSNNMRTAVAKYGINGSFTTVMYWFREWHMFSEYDVGLSSLASNMRLVSIAVSYIWIYILCNNLIYRKKCKNFIFMIISLILSFLNCIILGARGEAIQLIAAIYAIFCMLQSKYNNWRPNIKFKQIAATSIIVMILMISFKASGDMLGRSSVVNYGVSAIDEVAKYLGAEIKNLDIYLNETEGWENMFPGSQTFGNFLGWLGNKIGANWDIEIYLPFQKVNGISLGNVYTAFYAYIYDFGYLGNIIMTALLAICSQGLYEYIRIEGRKEVINFKLIVSSFFAFLVAFSFFGERFFSSVINISFLKYLIIWKLMIWYISKIKFRIGNMRI